MKQIFFMSAATAVLVLGGCVEQTKSGYYDLNSGKSITLVKDENTGLMLDAETKQPVYIYVNGKTNDTLYGATGEVINGQVVKTEDGRYKYGSLTIKEDSDGDLKIEDGDYKRKLDADGDLKEKDENGKTKVDGETGQVKKE
jgi:hypothetical protein